MISTSNRSARESSLALSRRRYQQGSLTKDGNRWVGRWREDVALPSGEIKRIRKKEILGSLEDLPTKKLAQRALAKRLEPVNHEDYRPTSTVTFGLFADKWMKEIMIHHKPSSRSSEESIINRNLGPYFDQEQLRNINLELIQHYVNTSEKSPKTVKNHISLLMVMWDMAQAWGYVQHNPFPRGTNGRLLLKLPAVVKGKAYNFTVEETLAIIDKAQGKWKVFFRILAETGMRPGELAGLRTCDVGPRVIRIAQSVWQQQVQTPKTENAIRTFAISAGLSEAIREVIDGMGELRDPNIGGVSGRMDRPGTDVRIIFTTDTGRPLGMDNFRHRVLSPILESLGIRPTGRCGLYAFRHMNMTELSRLGVPLKTIQGRVGHAPGSDVTMEHYIHAVSADDLAAADMIGALLSPRKGEAVQ
jgi:integrase